MTEVEELEVAADTIEQAGERATEGPWWFDESGNCFRLHGVAFRIPPQAGGAIPEQIVNKQIFKAAKRNTPYAEYWPDAADAAWMTLLTPEKAEPLAAALRSHAQDHHAYDCTWPEDECPHVRLARSINGTTGDPS